MIPISISASVRNDVKINSDVWTLQLFRFQMRYSLLHPAEEASAPGRWKRHSYIWNAVVSLFLLCRIVRSYSVNKHLLNYNFMQTRFSMANLVHSSISKTLCVKSIVCLVWHSVWKELAPLFLCHAFILCHKYLCHAFILCHKYLCHVFILCHTFMAIGKVLLSLTRW